MILIEARDWQDMLGSDSALVHSLAHIPEFKPGTGGREPIPDTFL